MKPRYTFGEELTNAITHGVGTIFGIVALTLLVTLAVLYGSTAHVVGFSIYGTTLIVMYSMSTLYHSFTNKRTKSIFQILDHSAIYLLIAGTYTPFTLVALSAPLKWIMLVSIWFVAAVGISFYALFPGRFKLLSTLFYVLMGWAVVAITRPMLGTVGVGGMLWLLAGGFFYTVGVVFYVMKKLKFHHGVWHLFVIAGSVCHFVVMIKYLL